MFQIKLAKEYKADDKYAMMKKGQSISYHFLPTSQNKQTY
jgi:hypothetical protein